MSRYFLYTFWCLVHERLMCLFIVCEIMFTTGESRAQMTQNNKHNKWLQFLAGENFSPKLLWRTPTFISEQIEVDNREAERKSLSTAKATSSTQWPQMYRSSDKILQLHCKRNRWREGTPTADPSKSDEEMRETLEVYSQNYLLRCSDRQQELHDLYKAGQEYFSSGLGTADQPLHHE